MIWETLEAFGYSFCCIFFGNVLWILVHLFTQVVKKITVTNVFICKCWKYTYCLSEISEPKRNQDGFHSPCHHLHPFSVKLTQGPCLRDVEGLITFFPSHPYLHVIDIYSKYMIFDIWHYLIKCLKESLSSTNIFWMHNFVS